MKMCTTRRTKRFNIGIKIFKTVFIIKYEKFKVSFLSTVEQISESNFEII